MWHRLRDWSRIRRDKFLYRLPISLIEHPFEVFIAFLCIISGPPLFFGGAATTPQSVDDLLPNLLVAAWALNVFLSGVTLLAGKFLHAPRVEQAGMALLASGSLIYGFAIFMTFNTQGMFAASTYFIIAFTAAIRYAVLGHTADRIRESQR